MTLILPALTVWVVPVLAGGAAVAAPGEASAKPDARCVSRAPEAGDSRDITCVVAGTAADQRLVFRVKFLGSHDDTILSMTASLDGKPLDCDPGSRMSSRFEDGDISLECRFQVKAGAAAKQVLQMRVVWTHAQYAEHELTAQ